MIYHFCTCYKYTKRRRRKDLVFFFGFHSFWCILLQSFITAYDVAKKNTCVLGLWTFPHHYRCYLNSVEPCPKSKMCIVIVLLLPRTCRSGELQTQVAQWGWRRQGEQGFRLIPLEAICFLSKTISYFCILPNYLKQTVGYAGSQITHAHIYYTQI